MWCLNMFYSISDWCLFLKKIYNYDSGGLSSGWPWIKLIMLLVRWQLTLFWIMRSSHNCPLLLFLYLTLFILAVTIYCSSLWLCVDCEILQQRTIWSWEVWQIFKEWVHLCLKSWWKCLCRVNVHNQMFLKTLISVFDVTLCSSV